MTQIASSNKEKGGASILKEICDPDCLLDNIKLLKVPYDKAFKEEFSTIDFLWLRRVMNSPWPSLVKSAVYRFLHIHDLYQVDRLDEVKKLVDYIFKEGEIPNDLHCREQMIHRCKKLILSTSHWARKGLLVLNKDNRLVKSAMFQNAWDNQLLITSIRGFTSSHPNVEEVEDTIAVKRPNNFPTKMSEANIVPDLFVAVSNPIFEERDHEAEFVTSGEAEPDIRIDPDGPVNSTNEYPRLPLVPLLGYTSPCITDVAFHDFAFDCHGLPNSEYDNQDTQVPPMISPSPTHVRSLQKCIKANVVFLKDMVQHNYPSEAVFLCQKERFEAGARLFVGITNKFNRIERYSMMEMIWQNDEKFLRFWKSLIKPQYTLIEFVFHKTPWLSGFTVDINADDDLVKARQHIWDGFWISIDRESRLVNPKFLVIAKPKLPQSLSVPSNVPSKRPFAGTHNLRRSCLRVNEKESNSNNTNEMGHSSSSARSDIQTSNGSAASCQEGRSIDQNLASQNLPASPKQPVGRPRNSSQQSIIAQPRPANAPSNSANVQKQPQPQQQFSQFQSPATSEMSRYHIGLPPFSFIEDPTFGIQTNNPNHQSKGGTLITEPVQLPNGSNVSLRPEVHQNSYRKIQQDPYAQFSGQINTQRAIFQGQRPPFPAHFPPREPHNLLPLCEVIMAPSQARQSSAKCPPRVPFHHPSLAPSPPISPAVNSISKLIPTIQFRIQLSPNGLFSTPYPKSILGIPGKPPVMTPQLFSWFINETQIGHKQDLNSLTFRLKDAVPVPVTYIVSRSGGVNGVDALTKLRMDIKRECENAGRLIMELERFEILVSMTVEEGGGDGMEERRNQILEGEW